jgi:hypothetical protein
LTGNDFRFNINGMEFSTHDADHDMENGTDFDHNCAAKYYCGMQTFIIFHCPCRTRPICPVVFFLPEARFARKPAKFLKQA